MEEAVIYPALQPAELFLRMVTAVLAGGVIGLNRERKEKTAGLRTCMLVSLAACVFTVITVQIGATLTVEERVVADPVRIVDAVTAGVAFIAAGAIIGKGENVSGLTTGAAVWLSGALGLAAGGGFYLIVAFSSFLGWVVLAVMKVLERRLLNREEEGD